MFEGVPWPQVTAASGGWLLFGYTMWCLITGRLVTKREADVYIERAEKAEVGRDKLIGTVAEMTGVGKLQKRFAEMAIDPPESGDSS